MNDLQDWAQHIRDNAFSNDETIEQKTETHKLDIQRVLSALDMRDISFYDRLTPAEKKSANTWMTMRWMSATVNQSEQYLTFVNLLVNKHFTTIYKHPELQWKLLAMCGSGRKQRHQWITGPAKRKQNPLEEALSVFFPLYSHEDIDMLLSLNGEDDLRALFKDAGYDDKTIKDLLKHAT